jgi:hypothetical protein
LPSMKKGTVLAWILGTLIYIYFMK